MPSEDRYSSRVLVAIPTYKTPRGMLAKAVTSVLAQTHIDIQVVVVADGEKPIDKLPRDDRLEVVQLAENRGTYFARDVALFASPCGWFAPHDSDDWTDPDHIENLLAVGCSAVASGAVWWHQGMAAPRIHRAVYEVGAFRTYRLTSIGGYNPAERMGQDSLMLRLLRHTGEVAATSQPTYHRNRREGSLTTAPETRIGSLARNEMRARNRAVFRAVQTTKDPKRIFRIRHDIVPQQLWDEIEEHASELRGKLS